MVLAYYDGRIMRIQDIVKELPMLKGGLYPEDLASYLVARGLNVRMNAWHREFPNCLAYLVPEQAKEALRLWAKRHRRTVGWDARKKKTDRSSLAKFLLNGGDVSPRLTTVNELWGSLVAGVPPILNVNAGVWRRFYSKKWRRDRNRARTAGHYVVLTDMDAKTMTLNDPSRPNGGKLVLPIELVMHALYSWGAAVIFAKPQTPLPV
jgi:hypothetical protein